ncbi:hypothetical protein [Chondromyces crocatus]|uniref:Uncharacterized protein n=1 Tax=Chondromyces crocatus TaxID=52 RepID=A0A0K1E6Q9_CHOCO|nr:hypothetical protein [Chondromyces crocatus]AKT36253.1 uncharacterized protein CMC5_003670 [Chondromyces crocatus]
MADEADRERTAPDEERDPAPRERPGDADAAVEESSSRASAAAEGAESAGSVGDVDGARPKRKKKKRRAADDAAEGEREAGPRRPAWWPAFARQYPEDPTLDRLVAAFEDGNYAVVRVEAEQLAKGSEREAVRRAAADLRRRVDPDPLAVVMLLASVGLLVFLSAWYWSHGHGP